MKSHDEVCPMTGDQIRTNTRRYKLIQNELGEYGVLDTFDGKPTELEYRRSTTGPRWTTDRAKAEQAMVKFENWHQRNKKENTWREVE
jgi:hypothetical protein